MKNCDEMVNSLLERREQYVIGQKRKRIVFTRTITSLGCICIVALLGFGVWKGKWFGTQSEQKMEDSLSPGIKDTFNENEKESTDNLTDDNKIIVHQIDGTAEKYDICLWVNDFVEMTAGEMEQYYGIDYVPDVPNDIKAWKNQRYGIYKRDDGTGEVYWDSSILNYSNENFTRNVYLEVAKKRLSVWRYMYFDSTEEKSVINNVEVMMGKSEKGWYYAEFVHKEVSFAVTAEGVSQDEFVEIITSVLD